MTPKEARALAKGERVRITAASPALAGVDGLVLDAVSMSVPPAVRGAGGWRVGRPPFVIVVGEGFTAAIAPEFVERL